MSHRTHTPRNQVKLSSVSAVRLARGGLKFEVAAYPSKVVDFRAGVEEDLDEVLQVVQVFSNVAQGVVVPKKKLAKAFPGMSTDAIIKEILLKGQLQVSERERRAKLDALARDISRLVAAMVVDAKTGDAVPPDAVDVILKEEVGFAPTDKKGAKQQALDLMKVLEKDFGLKRAPMRLQIPCADGEALAAALRAVDPEVVTDVLAAHVRCTAPPRCYRALAKAAAENGGGDVEVLSRAAKDAVVVANPPPPPDAAFLVSTSFQERRPPTAPTAPKPRTLSCNTCGGAFADAAAHRAHFKSDWHRCNLTRKTKGQPRLTEQEFEEEQATAGPTPSAGSLLDAGAS
mmetsp:Transcript_25139/g.75471  ORF Transcript_25139/g.75471 Transcript_25139/m.75471 type:complete len:344 (-) Transcript_25139:23-1054(-)